MSDHAGAGEQALGPEGPHLHHRPGGVSVFCWSRVWMGFSGFRSEGGGLLHLHVCQHHNSQWNPIFRCVTFSNPVFRQGLIVYLLPEHS